MNKKRFFSEDFWAKEFLELIDQVYVDCGLCLSVFPDCKIGCIYITDHVDTGYSIAYRSGLDHRLSEQHRFWRMVRQPKLTFESWDTPRNPNQTVSMDPIEARNKVEPWYLGCSVNPLFYPHATADYPVPALFVYPENHLVPEKERQVIGCIAKMCRQAIVITKDPIIVSCFPESLVFAVQTSLEVRYESSR